MGSAVKDLSFNSPRRPCAAPIWATQMRSATAPYPNASARRRAAGGGRVSGSGARGCAGRSSASGGRGLGRRRGLGGFLGLRFALFARDRADRIVALLALHDAGLIEEAQHPVGRPRALGEPGLHLVEIELEALGLIL